MPMSECSFSWFGWLLSEVDMTERSVGCSSYYSWLILEMVRYLVFRDHPHIAPAAWVHMCVVCPCISSTHEHALSHHSFGLCFDQTIDIGGDTCEFSITLNSPVKRKVSTRSASCMAIWKFPVVHAPFAYNQI